ncbi:MAG TPA: flavin reductase family protein [Devosia sp.]|jgi:flavin reductase (DIM6/NTAB) family NADH-FMN oxidoreductase RutF|uniref:flavin reductase family protein n=1 Tax=Devosia sp. TaxID=1871048 RepID=UPI002F93D078
MTSPLPSLDPALLRRALSMFATGVLIVTTRSGERVHGMTANSFTSVSLAPPLVLVCIDHRATMKQALLEAGHYGLSILAHEQEHLSRHFSSRKGAGVDVEFEDLEGIPVVKHALAQFSCRITQAPDAGDHLIFVGEVTGYRHGEGQPLLFFGGGYKQLHSASEAGLQPSA